MPLPSLDTLIGHLLPRKLPQQTLYRKEVRQHLVEVLQPLLTGHGFTPFKGTVAVRRTERWIDVVEIGFFSTVTPRPDSPGLDVGRFLTFVPPDELTGPPKEVAGQLWPTGSLCHLRKALFRPKRQKDTVWIIGNEQDLTQCGAEMLQLLQERAIPWFGWLDDLDTVLALLRDGQPDLEGKLRDPLLRGTWNFGSYFSRQVVADLVAFEAGHWTVCMELLAPVLQLKGVLGRNQVVLPLPGETLQTLSQVYGKAAAMANAS